MLYESTIHLLRRIVQSLEVDEPSWGDCVESGNECIYELHQMCRPARQAYKTAPMVRTACERALRAIPHVKLMNRAIRGKDRTAAIESARDAIAEMSLGGAASRSCA